MVLMNKAGDHLMTHNTSIFMDICERAVGKCMIIA